MNKTLKILGITLLPILLVTTLVIAAIYFWPLRTEHLQTGTSETVSYQGAIDRHESKNESESDRSVIGECKSVLKTHEEKTDKAVVFFHGITACPNQLIDLADHFFEEGYSVYIPLAPHHGTEDPREHSNISANELVDYVNESVTTTTGLGKEVGVVGLSGGGLLATWAAQYRPEVERLLVLAPFYEPATSQAPKWQLPLLKVLHGNHILPDAYSDPNNTESPGFSFRALAQYMIIGSNFKKDPSGLNLKSIGLVYSEDDDVIDKDLASSIPQSIASANDLELLREVLPSEWETGHAISSTDVPGVKRHQEELFNLYLDFYEGRNSSLEQ